MMLSRQSIMHEAGETGTCTGTISGPSSVPDTLNLATPPGRLMFQVQEAAACPGSLVIFQFSIRQEGTKDCKSIA